MDNKRSLSDLTGKARIRHAALDLFAIHGYAQTSLRLIAQHAGVSLALITHHFGSKHRLREAVDASVVETFEQLVSEVAATANTRTDEEICSDLADEVDHILVSRAELRAYLRRTVVVDGTASGVVLVNTLLGLMRKLFDRPDSRGGRDPAWQSLQFFLLVFGPTLLEPILHNSVPGIFAGKGSRNWHHANAQLMQFGLGTGTRVPPERTLRLVAHA